MDNDVFINIALDNALKNYILLKETKDYKLANDFLIYVVGMLINIYGEENIISLYEKGDEASFTYLLNKYNVDPYYVTKFYSDLDTYYKINIQNKLTKMNNPNPYFIYVQEDLINMLIAKYEIDKFDKKYFDKFKSMLFYLDNESEFVREYTYKMGTDNYILDYYNAKVSGVLNKLNFSLKRESVISEDVYNEFGLTKEKRDKLSYRERELMDTKIFKSFNLSPIELNVNKKILDEINESKKIDNISFKKLLIFVIIALLVVIIILLIVLKVLGVI